MRCLVVGKQPTGEETVFTRRPGSATTNNTSQPVEIDATELVSKNQATPSANGAQPGGGLMDPSTTVIGKNFTLEGESITIRCRGALNINGTIDADLHCEQITIGEAAQISGSIAADDVKIHGIVSGTISGSHVTLHKTARVSGDINSQFLTIERGAKFDGRSRPVTDRAEVAPKLMNSDNDVATNDANEPNTAQQAQRPQLQQQHTPAQLTMEDPESWSAA